MKILLSRSKTLSRVEIGDRTRPNQSTKTTLALGYYFAE